MTGLIRFIKKTSQYTGVVTACGLVVIFILIIIEVIAGSIFSTATMWSPLLVQLIFIPYFVLGGAYALLHGRHVAMNLVFVRLSRRAGAILHVATAGISVLFFGALLAYGVPFCLDALLSNQFAIASLLLRWPIWPSYLMVMIAILLLILQALVDFIQDLRVATGREPI